MSEPPQGGTGIRRRGWIALAILLLGTAAALTIRYSGTSSVSTLLESPPEDGPPVVVERATAAPLRAAARVAGTLRARRAVELGPEIAGRLVEVGAEVGDRLEAGAVAFRLEARDAQLRAEERRARRGAAQAHRDQAERRAARQERLGTDGVSPAQIVEEAGLALNVARADLEVAERELALAERELEKTVVRAPWRAVVVDRRADPGAWLVPGEPVLRLLDLAKVDVRVDLPAADAVHLRVGDPVEIRFPARPGETFAGQVRAVAAEADAADLQIPVLVELEGDRRFTDGLLAEVLFPFDQSGQGAAIPLAALERREGKAYVWRLELEDGTARRREVVVETIHHGRAILREGLEVGDQVIVSNSAILVDGMAIGTVAEAASAR